MKLFIAALAAGAGAAASGFGFPPMIAKVFPVVFLTIRRFPRLQNIIAHLVALSTAHTAVLVAWWFFANVLLGSIVSMKVLEETALFQTANAAPLLH